MIVCDIFVNIRFQLYRSGVHLGVVCGLLELEVPLRHGHLRVVPQLRLLPLLLSQRLRDLGVSAGLRLDTRSTLRSLDLVSTTSDSAWSIDFIDAPNCHLADEGVALDVC